MDIFLQLLINILITSSLYALLTAGFSLIYSVSKILHLAHGGVLVLGAYFLFQLLVEWRVNLLLAIFITIIFTAIIGWLMNKLVYEIMKKRKAGSFGFLVATIGLLLLLTNVALAVWGPSTKVLDFPFNNSSLSLGGALITRLQIIIVASALLLLVIVFLFLKKSKLGVAMRAAADDETVAEIVGINTKRTINYAFLLGSLLAGIAAVFISWEFNIQPQMGVNFAIKAFTAAIIGGVGSVPGAILGSFIVGGAENIAIWFLPSAYGQAATFVLLFLFLLLRPWGLLGFKDNR